jgi:hypothetical protein
MDRTKPTEGRSGDLAFREARTAALRAAIERIHRNENTNVKILLTGAAGFIGFHTARRLLARGDEVVGLDNLNDYYDPTLKRARLSILEREPKFRFVKWISPIAAA